MGHVRQRPQRLNVLQGSTRVQATGRIIPALNAGFSDHGLSDTYTLFLSSRDAANKFIANLRSQGMFDPEKLCDNTKKFRPVVGCALTLVTRFFTRGTTLQSKLETNFGVSFAASGQDFYSRVLHRNGRIVEIVFRIVDDFSTIMLSHGLCVSSTISHIPVHTLIAISLIRQDFEKGRTARSWFT